MTQYENKLKIQNDLNNRLTTTQKIKNGIKNNKWLMIIYDGELKRVDPNEIKSFIFDKVEGLYLTDEDMNDPIFLN